MAPNKSVQRFKALTDTLKKEVHQQAVEELNNQAENLAHMIKKVAPRGETGDLVHSIRVVPDRTKDTVVRVVEGGQTTIKDGYNYPRADEFGTVNMQPKPHFFPTYRLLKKKMISSMKRKITASIKKRSAQ